MHKTDLSIVIPVYNEEQLIKPLVASLLKLSRQLPARTEIIIVNDGSTDQTQSELLLAAKILPMTILSLSRNFGHQAALFAGLEKSRGEIVVTMDGDLQHPPELILDMLKQHQLGYDVVLTKRIDTQEIPWHKQLFSKIFYQFINYLSDTPIPLSSSDFRSLNRSALAALLQLPEKRKFLRGMVAWVGFKSVVLPFVVLARTAGKSKYSLTKMVNLAMHGLTSFSTLPLYLSGYFSLVLFCLSFIYGIYVVYQRLFVGTVVSGWASVLLAVLIIGGFISLFLAMLSVYIAAIFEEVKNRPFYIIKDTYDTPKA